MTDPDLQARDLYQQLIESWNERRPDDFAALFATDGAIIGFDGSQADGADEIAEHLRGVFGDHPTARYVAKVRSTRPLGGDCVLVRAIVGMIPPGAERLKPETNALQTLIAQRGADGWRIALFQNTPAQYHGRPELVEAHTAELEPLATAGTAVR